MVDRKKFLLRIPEPLWEELRRWAASEMRSVNGQIEFLLKQAVKKHTGKSDEELEDSD